MRFVSKLTAVCVLFVLATKAQELDFSLTPQSPKVPSPYLAADDIEAGGLAVRIPATDLGVMPTTDITGLSYGQAEAADINATYFIKRLAYSVDTNATGSGAPIATERTLDGAAGDTFALDFVGLGIQRFVIRRPFNVRKAETRNLTVKTNPVDPEDDIDGLALFRGTKYPVYTTFAPGSGFDPASIYMITNQGGPAELFASATDLGLVAGDVIDAFALGTIPFGGPPPTALSPNVVIWISLDRASPSRGAVGDNILQVWPTPRGMVLGWQQLNLGLTDEINALAILDPGVPIIGLNVSNKTVYVHFTGKLQWANSTDGPWTDLPNATSPYTEIAAEFTKFFRSLVSGDNSVPTVTGNGQEPTSGSGRDADAAAIYATDGTGGSRRMEGSAGQEPATGVPESPGWGNSTASKGKHDTVVSNGEKRLDRLDMRIPGRGQVNFELRRRYRSQLAYDGPLGYGWDFTYNETLFVQGNGNLVRSDGSGHQDTWTAAGGGSFNAPAGNFGTLRQEPEGSFTLREPDGFKRFYNSNGRLTGYRDRFGNTMSFAYDVRGNLHTVTDVFGRQIEFLFMTFADGRDRLVTVRDFVGREVQFSYTPAGDLAEVRSPVVTGTTTGNDFPSGRTERYTYREGTGTALDHNLLTVTRPEEVALGGPPAIIVHYGDTSGTTEFDRVTSETLGGINASTVPAGGTVSYSYTLVNQAAGPDPSLPRLDVLVTERNGNQLLLRVNERGHLIAKRRFTRGLRPGEPAYYETLSEYTADGQLTRRTFPSGNQVVHSYTGAPRAAQRNRVQTRRVADATHGGDDLVVTRTFDPLYQQLASYTDPRENDPSFVPPNGGANAPGRYTRTWFFDYQEGNAPVAEATEWGISLASVARDLGDLNGDGDTSQDAGNCVREEGPAVNLDPASNMAALLGDTTQEIVTEYQWNDRGQLTSTIDPEGNQTTCAYYPENDPDGDGSPVPGQDSVLTRGYLNSRTRDAGITTRRTSTRPPTALETKYYYDPVGYVTGILNPRGVRTDYEVNPLGEVVAVTRGADTAEAIARGQLPTAEAALGYETRMDYNHNGWIVGKHIEDDPAVSTTPGIGDWEDLSWTYDINGNLLQETRELGGGTDLVTTCDYDANGNRTAIHYPNANRAVDPATDNVLTISYDERDLPLQITEGAGGPTAGASQMNYDGNGNLTEIDDAEDNNGDSLPESTTIVYDGYDRPTARTAPERTETRWSYDPAGNIVSEQVWGLPGNAPNPDTDPIQRLAEKRYVRDELARVCQTDEDLFVCPGVTPVRAVNLIDGNMDGAVTTKSERDADGNLRFRVEDDGGVYEWRYDGAGRLAEVHHGLGNLTEYFYDANDNLLRQVETEHSPENLVPDRVLTTYNVFNQLDQKIRTTDPLGETERWGFDSRGNLVSYSDGNGEQQAGPDPLGVFPGPINDPGNTHRWERDGTGRCTAEVTDLFVGGRPGPTPTLDVSNPFNPDGQIRVEFGYDLNGNRTSITDDNGNTTTFGFDARNRLANRTLADGSSYTFDYDRDNNLVNGSDPNGTSVAYTYDAANRLVRTDVIRGAGVLGTTQQTFAWDGLGNLISSSDDNGGTVLAGLQRVYNSLGNVLEETQGSRQRQVSTTYDGDGSVLSQTYAEGKTYTRTYDDLDRLKTITDPNSVVDDIDYLGPHPRELQRTLGGTLNIYYHDQVGTPWYNDAGRLTRTISRDLFGSVWIERNYTYDGNGRFLSEERVDDYNQTDEFARDSANRVVAARSDQFGIGGISRRNLPLDEITYDGAGNRRQVVHSTSVDSPATTDYDVNVVNAYTTIGGTPNAYDANGNLINDGIRTYDYDFLNRLVRVALVTGEELAVYTYDTEGRRVTRLFKNAAGTVLADVENYYDQLGRAVEEWSFKDDAPFFRVVYAQDHPGDSVLLEVALPSWPLDSRTWFVRDPYFNLIGWADSFGFAIEKYIYDAFGNAYAIYGGEPTPPFLYHGMTFDSETGHYLFGRGRRYRYYVPDTGRYMTWDPASYNPVNAGNPYSFAGNDPTRANDHRDQNDTVGCFAAGGLLSENELLIKQPVGDSSVRKPPSVP